MSLSSPIHLGRIDALEYVAEGAANLLVVLDDKKKRYPADLLKSISSCKALTDALG